MEAFILLAEKVRYRHHNSSAVDIYKKFKQIEERKERKVLLPHWYLALDEQLDERLHLKMTIAK
jgi:hypothetical protein